MIKIGKYEGLEAPSWPPIVDFGDLEAPWGSYVRTVAPRRLSGAKGYIFRGSFWTHFRATEASRGAILGMYFPSGFGERFLKETGSLFGAFLVDLWRQL